MIKGNIERGRQRNDDDKRDALTAIRRISQNSDIKKEEKTSNEYFNGKLNSLHFCDGCKNDASVILKCHTYTTILIQLKEFFLAISFLFFDVAVSYFFLEQILT